MYLISKYHDTKKVISNCNSFKQSETWITWANKRPCFILVGCKLCCLEQIIYIILPYDTVCSTAFASNTLSIEWKRTKYMRLHVEHWHELSYSLNKIWSTKSNVKFKKGTTLKPVEKHFSLQKYKQMSQKITNGLNISIKLISAILNKIKENFPQNYSLGFKIPKLGDYPLATGINDIGLVWPIELSNP